MGKIEKKYFTLIKDLTILSGTVFGSSIALSVGRDINLRFLFGEILLFISLCAGIINLYASLRGEEFFHFLMTIGELKRTLPKRTGGKEDFIVDAQEDSIKSYERLLEKNKKDPLAFLLRLVKIDYFYPALLITFLLGIFFILFSLIQIPPLPSFQIILCSDCGEFPGVVFILGFLCFYDIPSFFFQTL